MMMQTKTGTDVMLPFYTVSGMNADLTVQSLQLHAQIHTCKAQCALLRGAAQ